MKNKNVKVIDEHNIDRNANIMFALELEGSEYVVYWISRDEESNNVFVSKVLKNLDGTFNMLNIDEEEKKKEISEIVKTLISNSVTDQNDKLVGVTTTLSNGKVVKFVNVSFNKEQQINVTKTYITTVKKEVTKVAETYYDVAIEEAKVEPVLPSMTPVAQPAPVIFPELATSPVETAQVVAQPTPVVVESITAAQPVMPSVPVTEAPVVVAPAPEVVSVQPVVSQPVVTPVVQPAPVVEPVAVIQPVPTVEQPVAVVQPVVQAAESVAVTPTSVVSQPVAPTVTVETQPVEVATPQVVAPVPEPAVVAEPLNQPLVFNAAKETNLNAALGEVANSATIAVTNIEPVREFGVETPVTAQPTVAPTSQTDVASSTSGSVTGKAGFANSKFFMVVAIAFFLASCVFLGYEVYNYFQLVK